MESGRRTGTSAVGTRRGLDIARLGAMVWLGGCGGGELGTNPPLAVDDPDELTCSVSASELAFALVPDAISSLSDPPLVRPDHPDAEYVLDSSRVLGLVLDGQPVAVPLNVLRVHEVVNLSPPEGRFAVTYCPLTASSLVFDRSPIDGVELGVSGVLWHNNLVLFDRAEHPSFFSQMGRGIPICGPGVRSGTVLPVVPSAEIRWDAWLRLHPETLVVSEETGGVGDYRVNPYVEYERIDNPGLLFDFPVDPRRPVKERVLGIPAGGDGGIALPFGELEGSARRAISVFDGSVVVLWDRSAEAAIAFSTDLAGQRLVLSTTESGFLDVTTGSEWAIDGLAVSGPLAGRRLKPVQDAYVSFWFAWAAFHPETVVWTASSR